MVLYLTVITSWCSVVVRVMNLMINLIEAYALKTVLWSVVKSNAAFKNLISQTGQPIPSFS